MHSRVGVALCIQHKWHIINALGPIVQLTKATGVGALWDTRTLRGWACANAHKALLVNIYVFAWGWSNPFRPRHALLKCPRRTRKTSENACIRDAPTHSAILRCAASRIYTYFVIYNISCFTQCGCPTIEVCDCGWAGVFWCGASCIVSATHPGNMDRESRSAKWRRSTACAPNAHAILNPEWKIDSRFDEYIKIMQSFQCGGMWMVDARQFGSHVFEFTSIHTLEMWCSICIWKCAALYQWTFNIWSYIWNNPFIS